MSFAPNPQGDTNARINARVERLVQEARLRSGTVRTPPLPVHLTTGLIRQRVEIKTRTRELVGVVVLVSRGEYIGIAEPGAYDLRGFWTHKIVPGLEVFSQDNIERLTVLEGPAGEAT